MPASADPVMQDNEDTPVARARRPPPGPTAEELDKHELTHVVFRSWCKHCISSRAREDPHRTVATHEGRTPKVMLDWMFFTSDQEPGVQLPVLVVYDLSTAVMAFAVNEGFFCGDSWNCGADDGGVVSHRYCTARGSRTGDEIAGEVSCECQSTSNSAKTRTASQSSKPKTCRSMHSGLPWDLCGKQVGSGSWNRLSSAAETSCNRVAGQTRCLADHQIQHWTRWMLSLQEDLWEILQWWHLQVR